MKKIGIGIIGTGTVGSGVLELIEVQRKFFNEKIGIQLEIKGISARSEASLAKFEQIKCLKSTNPLDLCSHSEIQIILELAGGYEAPREWILTALKNGKHVITANKAMLAKYGWELFPLAEKNNCGLYFEAAIGGGIPIVKTLQESLIANDIEGLACIINGTCNYILTEMTEHQFDFDKALIKAKKLGYAEADPSFDVEGIDSAHKVALLASLSFGQYVDFEKMNVEGISHIQKFDVDMATELGYCIKLLGVVQPEDKNKIFASVHPALLETSHQLATVNDVLNAVFIESSAAGPLLLTGAGAGKLPTASSVMGDLISLSRQMLSTEAAFQSAGFINKENEASLVPIGNFKTKFYLRFTTKDYPGVIAKITSVLAAHDISIESFIQKPDHAKHRVPVIIITHKTPFSAIDNALKEIDALDIITSKTQFLRFYH